MTDAPPPPGAPDGPTPGVPPVPPTPPVAPPPAQPTAPTAPAYGQPTAPTVPAYGQPGYGQPAYGQPSYGQPAYGQQPVYGQPAYGAPVAYGQPGYAAVPRTNPLAIAALITACGGVLVWILAPIAGAIMGHIAMGQIKRTGENGRGLAFAGILVGWILGGLQLLVVIAYIVFIIVVATNAARYGYYSGS